MRLLTARALRLQPISLSFALWPFVRPDRNRLCLAIGLSLVLTAIEVAIPALAGLFTDAIVADFQDRSSALLPDLSAQALLTLLVVCGLVRALVLMRRRGLLARIGENVAARLRETQWRHQSRLPLAETERRGPGRLILRFTSDTRPVQRFVGNAVVILFSDVLRIGLVLLVMVAINWRMALPAILALVSYLAIFRLLNPGLQRAVRATRKRRLVLSAHLSERLAGMRAIKAFAREQYEASQIRRLSRDLADRATRQAVVSGRLDAAGAAVATAAIALILVVAALEVSSGRVSAGGLVAFVGLSQLLWPSFSRLMTADRQVQEAQVLFDRIKRTLRMRVESPGDSHRPTLDITQGVVSVQKVSVSYGETPALERVSLTAQRGRLVAIVGPNGAGKSTLFDVILRFVDPTSGVVKIDGQNVARLSTASLRTQIGLVSPEATLFSGSIRENITVGRDYTDGEIHAAVQQAGLVDVTADLSAGLETQVGTGGTRISAGTRQRIALARALISDPPILLLDEITAAMDAESQQALATVLGHLKQTKTLIVITGSRPVLSAADRIYVLENGTVVARGVHRKLVRSDSAYSRLVRVSLGRGTPVAATA